MEINYYGSQWGTYYLITDTLNIFFQQKKDSHTGLEQFQGK